jgi:hypothetical protein
MNTITRYTAHRLAVAEQLMDAARSTYDRSGGRYTPNHFRYEAARKHFNRLCFAFFPVSAFAPSVLLHRQWPAPTGGQPLVSDYGQLAYVLERPDHLRRSILVHTPGEETRTGLWYYTTLDPTLCGWRATFRATGYTHEESAGFAFTRAGALRKTKRSIRKHFRRVARAMP